MGKGKVSLAAIIGFCGACIAFYIGAGFATMQEVMQYDASYGSLFFVVVIVAMGIYLYTNLSFATNGNRLKLERGGDIYGHYCGKYIGKFYDYFAAIFCYVCFFVMCGAANSTAQQQWGLPNGVGAIILTVAVVATVVFGLDGIVNALGKIGPVIVVMIFALAIISLGNNIENLPENMAAVDAGEYSDVISQVGGGNPIASGASYAGFVILWFATFLAEMGAKNRLREVNIGMILSTVFIAAATILCVLALIADIPNTSVADIPALVMANKINPVFGTIYAFIVFCGIYTTSVPLLWTGIGRIAKEGTAMYRLFVIIGGCLGCAVACFLPYQGLVNILYGLNGYVGFALVAFMIIHDVRTRMGTKRVKSIFPGGDPEPTTSYVLNEYDKAREDGFHRYDTEAAAAAAVEAEKNKIVICYHDMFQQHFVQMESLEEFKEYYPDIEPDLVFDMTYELRAMKENAKLPQGKTS
ncbi:hypothetical protein [Adlercreutzia sp. ZJ138]|uniref:YkvI family membrane protein n=1 Tax=Adlercreutzia sp. ZJ138 TaxID=2709405 RepID=UPI00198120D8|nr:hypothetical protein [Adlercreutzia sp. ZJ138]